MKLILLLSCAASVAAVICSSSSASAAKAGIGPSFKGPVGLQLYSLRAQFPKDVPGTLDEVKGWGIKYAELAGTYGLSAGEFTKELAAHGIKPIGAHFDYNRYKDDPEGVAREAKELGLKYAGVPGFLTTATSMRRRAATPPLCSTKPAKSWRNTD